MPDKKVTYLGRGFVVPDWAQWLATDGNGTVKAYRDEPVMSQTCPHWESSSKSKMLTLIIDPIWKVSMPDWRGTKVKFKK